MERGQHKRERVQEGQNVVTSEKGVIKNPGEVQAAWNKKDCLTLVLYSNILTRELNILLRIETNYRWVHIFNELSAHESPSTLKHEQWMLPSSSWPWILIWLGDVHVWLLHFNIHNCMISWVCQLNMWNVTFDLSTFLKLCK